MLSGNLMKTLLLLSLWQLQVAIPQPEKAESLWQAMADCSGVAVQPGGDLSDVKWFTDSLVAKDRFHAKLGAWFPPDSIVLDVDRQEPWVVAHELLHHRLRGPPLPKDRLATIFDTHPFNPFSYPCRVMPYQWGG